VRQDAAGSPSTRGLVTGWTFSQFRPAGCAHSSWSCPAATCADDLRAGSLPPRSGDSG